MQELSGHLSEINTEHEYKKEKLENQIQKGKRIMDELSDKLIN
jgi:hypothetical protein